MENCLNYVGIKYKSVKEYKHNINKTIEDMICNNERLTFAIIVKKSDITPFTINKYPELRKYILYKIKYYKEIQVINKKIYKSISSLLSSNKTLTFTSIASKCGFSLSTVYNNNYIKTKIRMELINNKNLK
ncbi:hypothetical protein [Clostridium botulinum]|uniref:Uncharacterized protein n=3 Tax=Clostridium botulinum TaxID=1491 RepID=A0A9Q1UX16_CLOBO|nr:hypothetical protein [Clostridium botulinum]AEB76321.1 hypothetical protein CbC4_1644 [Clostridium botulinum BKT015925]KEI02645.1 hypothetical protein Y848_06930 [Clostridium botulinum C/D str. Sp77]KLU75771.1 hypothetical protein CBC3_06605 [Clostridium botulinum V891]KOA72679.1 hypothetical protein ADU78_14495 [Clostridium botulinum]KOA77298.1 hypothetical protein ADU77_07830 [Clostridium botulinum]